MGSDFTESTKAGEEYTFLVEHMNRLAAPTLKEGEILSKEELDKKPHMRILRSDVPTRFHDNF